MDSRTQLSSLIHTDLLLAPRDPATKSAKNCQHPMRTRMQLPLCSLGAWILTNGLRFGITKQLGQAVRDHSLASTSSKVRVVAIGIAPWNMIHNREALLTAKVSARTHRDDPAPIKKPNNNNNKTKTAAASNSKYLHFSHQCVHAGLCLSAYLYSCSQGG